MSQLERYRLNVQAQGLVSRPERISERHVGNESVVQIVYVLYFNQETDK